VLRPTHSLLAALVSTTVVVTAALGWAGWRLTDQQRVIDEQRARDQVESAADAVAAGIREKLADAGERLSGWLSNPSSAAPAIEGAVVIAMAPARMDVNPSGGLPFVLAPIESTRAPDTFAAVEAIEFGADRVARAADGYRELANGDDLQVRAGALLRVGRVLRKSRDFAGALTAYRQLAELGAIRTDGLPSELAGLDGQRATYTAMAKGIESSDVAGRILQGLDSGRWQIARGTAEFYRDAFAQPRPASWTLATALDDVWREAAGRLPVRGQRVVRKDPSSIVFVLWRSNGTHTAALAAFAGQFFDVAVAAPVAWQLVDPEGHVIRGEAASPARSVVRIIGNSEYPWTLRMWAAAAPASGRLSSRAILLAMMAAALVFVWGASYFMARAIRHEAAVARLQSDFVAAVSHEFRSPLTTVRQMAEMLEGDRVPTDERRHTYYKILAGEATRLQRLVETLLNFGKMEAGAEHYRFVDVDAAALVREVVDEIGAHAHESGKAIEIDGPPYGIRVLADQSALAVALRNLIDNAIKYSPDQPTVWVQWRQDNDRTAISVVDRGVGIPRSEQQTIFRKFVRGRAAIDANIKGTGLGLSMVQQIVTAHGGEIRVDSEPGRGSTFTLLLPAVS
jgi:signal transduction histidine kinase